jgi:hypothetical protein
LWHRPQDSIVGLRYNVYTYIVVVGCYYMVYFAFGYVL